MFYFIANEGAHIKLEGGGTPYYLVKKNIAAILPLSGDLFKIERNGAPDIVLRWRDITNLSTPDRDTLITTISQWII